MGKMWCTFEASPLVANSCMVIWTAPCCFGPQGTHIPSGVLMKNIASWVLRTGSKSTSFTCKSRGPWTTFWLITDKDSRHQLKISVHPTNITHLHKLKYLNPRNHLSCVLSFQNLLPLNYVVYPPNAPIWIGLGILAKFIPDQKRKNENCFL